MESFFIYLAITVFFILLFKIQANAVIKSFKRDVEIANITLSLSVIITQYLELLSKNSFVDYPKLREYFFSCIEVLETMISTSKSDLKQINIHHVKMSEYKKFEGLMLEFERAPKEMVELFNSYSGVLSTLYRLKHPFKHAMIIARDKTLLFILHILLYIFEKQSKVKEIFAEFQKKHKVSSEVKFSY